MGENRLKKRFSGILTCTMIATLMSGTPTLATTGNIELSEVSDQNHEVTTGSMIEIVGTEAVTQVTTFAAITMGNWEKIAFGTGITLEDHSTTIEGDTITMTSQNDGNSAGKVSSNKDGINFYYQELSATDNFEIKVKANVKSYVENGQVSFGIMLRDTIGENGSAGDEAVQGAKMLGVGLLNKNIQSYARTEEKGKYASDYTFISGYPNKETTYELGIKKSGDAYQFLVNGIVTQSLYSDQFTDNIFAGIYTARAASVEYTDLEVTKCETISELNLESKPTKLNYLEDETLDLSGLVVKADGEVVNSDQLIVSGYNPKQVGTQTVTLHYAGQTVSFDVTVEQLTCVGIEVLITPAKTTYYIDDAFDATGIVVKATYNSGKVITLSELDYVIEPVDLSSEGVKTVKLSYEGQMTQFDITVLSDQLTGLEIAKMPVKILYYIGEDFDEKGMAIKAVYGDSKVLLETNEYTISTEGFNSAVAGEQFVTIHYKGQTLNVPVTVKEKEATHIEVTTQPKTTYELGEDFSEKGLVISKVYDDGSKVELLGGEYAIDASNFDGTKAGSYTIQIIPTDETFKSITFLVDVREPIVYEWKYKAFGQSTGEEKNYVEQLEDGGIKLVALEGAGKITNSFQDGITYYYTELNNAEDNFVLSADFKVNKFAKDKPDNQEGFGIMARDAIGTHNDSSVFYSNIAAVGGYRGCTQMLMRSGVTSSDSTGAATGLQEETVLNGVRPDANNTGSMGTYHLTLKKDNTGYTGYLTTPSGTVEKLYYEPDALGVQNDTLYVGFYAARLADIDIYNIKLDVTSAASDAPKIEAPQQAITPNVYISSLSASSTTDYDLKMYASVDGTVTIKQGETIIARDVEVKGGEFYQQETILETNAVTPFTVTFTPDTAQNLTSYNKIVRTLSVEMKTYGAEGEAIYVSPTGSSEGEGTLESPLSIQRAIDFVKAGQTIYLLEGNYDLSTSIGIDPGNNGTADAVKTLAAYPGKKVTINAGKRNSGFTLDGDYWHIFGIDFTGARSTGFRVGGNYNTVELCNTYGNGDTGLQISRYGNGGYDTWPSNNLILNCTSYDNMDNSENNADGFAAKLTCGPGNVFKGCISHNNIDDAWDLFAKGSTGPIGAVTIEECIAYSNGTLTNGYVGKGDKNGFKLGGEGIAVPHMIKNSISFNNGAAGFSSNSNPAVISENCIAYDNEGANFDWRVYTDVTPQFVATGNISYKSQAGTVDVYPTSLINKSNYYYNGEKSVNAEGTILKDANFKSLVIPESYERDSVGNIVWGDFLKFVAPTIDDDEDDYDYSNSAPQGSVVTNSDKLTADKVEALVDQAISEGKTGSVTVSNTQPTVELGTATIEQLVKTETDFVIHSQKVAIAFESEFFSANILSQFENKNAIKINVSTLSSEVLGNIQSQLNQKETFKVVGGTELTTVLSIKADKALEKFNEPAELTMNLEGVTIKDASKLTLVKYELQEDGTYNTIKLGGTYDAKAQIFTGKVAGTGTYGIVEADDLLKVNLTIGAKEIVVNDQFINNDVAPEISKGSTLVPLRFIAEHLGAEVKWDHKAKEVTVILDGESITLGEENGLELKNNRTIVPLRYVSENLGAHVLWIPSTKEIQIVK